MVKYPPCFPLPSVLGELWLWTPLFLQVQKTKVLSNRHNAWSLCERYIIELKISVPEIPTGITKVRIALATNSFPQIACHGFPKGRQIFSTVIPSKHSDLLNTSGASTGCNDDRPSHWSSCQSRDQYILQQWFAKLSIQRREISFYLGKGTKYPSLSKTSF